MLRGLVLQQDPSGGQRQTRSNSLWPADITAGTKRGFTKSAHTLAGWAGGLRREPHVTYSSSG